MRVHVYIDGFNLYYGALRNSPHKWLNVATLAQLLLPEDDIVELHNFTALVKSRVDDPAQRQRQQLYLRALNTLGNLRIHYGHFVANPVQLPLLENPTVRVNVLRTEEKGSDVNLATQLLLDGFYSRYETAVVISNDSDLVSPIRAVRDTLGIPVGILCPFAEINQQMKRSCTFFKFIREGALAASQFPAALKDHRGDFFKPPAW